MQEVRVQGGKQRQAAAAAAASLELAAAEGVSSATGHKARVLNAEWWVVGVVVGAHCG
jgi:hypothetical protein